jgi:hypothetical protein
LLVLAGPYQREAIYAALHELSPIPEDVLPDAIIAGDHDALARWRDSVIDGWMLSPWCLPEGPDRTDPHAPGDEPPSKVPPSKVPPMSPDKARDPTGWGPQ